MPQSIARRRCNKGGKSVLKKETILKPVLPRHTLFVQSKFSVLCASES